ncbi:MAG: hypothetical protein ACP5DZ_05570 [Bacteroidales bacterium]
MTMGKFKNIDGKGYDLLYIDTDNYMDTAGNKIPKKEIEKRINNYLKAYDSSEFIKQKITDIQINDEENDAVAIMDVNYKAWVENKKLSENFQGKANFRLRPSEYGGWRFTALTCRAGLCSSYILYFPIQKCSKICPSTSSVVISPVMLPR